MSATNRPKGLYCYDTAPAPGTRAWRPDLVPTILSWLADIPEEDWQHFAGFAVDSNGGFAAHFVKEPRRGGPPRRVTFSLDHGMSSLQNDCKMWLKPDAIVPYSTIQLDAGINVFADSEHNDDDGNDDPEAWLASWGG